jgi:excisionase family DNA binding protein
MQTEIASTPATHKIAFTVKEAARASGLSRSLLYLAIGRGALRAKKCGARTLILESDLRRFLRSLPKLAAGEACETAPGRGRNEKQPGEHRS